MRKRLAAVVLSLGLALGMDAMTDNTVQAQQAAEAASPKAAETGGGGCITKSGGNSNACKQATASGGSRRSRKAIPCNRYCSGQAGRGCFHGC